MSATADRFIMHADFWTRDWHTRAGTLMALVCLMFLLPEAALGKPFPQTESQAQEAKQKSKSLHKLVFRAEGGSCPSCARALERAIRQTSGVESAEVVKFHPAVFAVVYDTRLVSVRKIIIIAERQSFVVTGMKDTTFTP